MKYNILIGGIHIESSSFSVNKAKKEDFIILKDKELINNYNYFNDFDNINLIPLIHARALPDGEVSISFFEEFLKEFLNLLKEKTNEYKIDGLLLDIHGAMKVENMFDSEGYIIEKIRKISPNIKISTTTDLHGNISEKLFNNTNLITTYKTAPHIDQIETKRRALKNLIYLLNNKNNIYESFVRVPILLPGEMTSTNIEPAKSLYNSLKEIEEDKDILDASIWMGFPWVDEKRASASLSVTGINKEKVINITKKLSNKLFSIKEDFKFVSKALSLKDSFIEANNSNLKPFVISDTGDNPGAGGLGDLNLLLKEALKYKDSNKRILIASIKDSEAINILKSSNKERLNINIGNKIDPSFGPSINLDVTIINKRVINNNLMYLVRHKNIDLIITEKRFQFGKISYFNNILKEDIKTYDIVSVKMGYLEPEIKDVSKAHILALTKGSVNQDLLSLNYNNLNRPIYPFDKNFKFNKNIIIKENKNENN